MAQYMLMAFVCCAGVSLALAVGEWSYNINAANGPGNWGGLCGGPKQSPININTTTAIYDSGLGVFTLGNYGTIPDVNFTVENSGYSLVVSFPSFIYNVSGGGLTGTYTTAQFHLHWGSVNNNGSEHAVDGKFYAAEIHFVSFNVKYPDVATAKNYSDGLAVLGVFLEVANANTNAHYDSFLNAAKYLTNKGSSFNNVTASALANLLPSDKTKFYRYNGSLTTPTCNEAVTWTVFRDPVKITQAQLNVLRALKMNNKTSLEYNCRPLQGLGNRTVKASFEDTPTTTAPTGTAPIATQPDIGIALEKCNVMLLLMLFGALFLR